jgi:hypothetical protein
MPGYDELESPTGTRLNGKHEIYLLVLNSLRHTMKARDIDVMERNLVR